MNDTLNRYVNKDVKFMRKSIDMEEQFVIFMISC